MAAFTPTPAERQKYAHYGVEVREAERNAAHVSVSNETVVRWLFQVHRIPSEQLFVVWIYKGATPDEFDRIVRLAATFPAGEWARFPDQWQRSQYKRSRRVFHRQNRGLIADDPFAQLELEMMIDATSEVHA